MVRRILIDSTMARTGGGYTYVANLVPALCALAGAEVFRLLLRNEALARDLPPHPRLEIEVRPEVGLAGRARFTYRELPRLAAEWRADVLFAAGELVPLRAPCPVVASFRNPNVFGLWRGTPARLVLLRALCALSARASDRVLFVSHDSARWMGDRAGVPPERRVVIHHGVDRTRFEAAKGPRPHPRPYVLTVGHLYSYKNHVRLVEAWRRLAGRRSEVPDLVILGLGLEPATERRVRQAREACGDLAARVHLIGGVEYGAVAAWYRHATLFAFPSLLETFGHPLLEAMAAGVPVVAADTPVAHEVAGDGAHYVDARDVERLSQGLEEALFDAGLRAHLVERGTARSRELGWEASARRYLALFEALGSPGAEHETPDSPR